MAIISNNAEALKLMGYLFDYTAQNFGSQLFEYLYPINIVSDRSGINGDLIRQNIGMALSSFLENEQAPTHFPSDTFKIDFTPSRVGGKKVIDSTMRLMENPGTPENAPAASHISDRYMRMMRTLLSQLYIAKNRMALETIIEGKFIGRDVSGNILDDYDFGRSDDNKFDFSLSTAGNTFSKAIIRMYNILLKKGVNAGGLAILMGSNWIAHMAADTELAKDAQGNQWAIMANFAPDTKGVDGLYLQGMIKPRGVGSMISVFNYEPAYPLVTSAGVASYIPDDKLIMFPIMGSSAFRCSMGFDTMDGLRVIRSNAEAIVDVYVDPATVAEYVRIMSRPFFGWGEINHTGTITAT